MTPFETHSHYRLIEKAIRLIEQHASFSANIFPEDNATEPSLRELASLLHISPHHLQRTFTAWAGISPKQFFQCLQKDHARRLIASRQSILNASEELGLPSVSKLHRLMVKFEAMTPGEIKNQGEDQVLVLGQAESPFGQTFVGVANKGINSLEFETEFLTYDAWKQSQFKLYPKAVFQESNAAATTVIKQVFNTTTEAPSHFNVYLKGTPFQLQVWQALIHLPVSQLASYQQLAAAIGKPLASRAVGSAVAKNPVAFLIPCHRVIQSTGELGQYRWQSERKRALHLWEQGQVSFQAK